MTNLPNTLTSYHLKSSFTDPIGGNSKGIEAQDQRLKEAAQGFEGLFLQQMLKSARATSFGDDLLGSSAVEKTQDLFDMELTKSASSSSGLGIAEAIYKQMAPLAGTKR